MNDITNKQINATVKFASDDIDRNEYNNLLSRYTLELNKIETS